LITFPVLLAVGVPAVEANVTNTVALTPGYLSAAVAQRRDLRGQRARLRLLLPAAAIGGVAGGVLLLRTSEQAFRGLVPYLILVASGLLAVQGPVRTWIQRRVAAEPCAGPAHETMALLPTALAAVYGGYFGAALSVIVLAVLVLAFNETLTRLNALKQAIAFAVNTAAAILFVFSGRTIWRFALIMTIGAVLGGAIGGRMASRLRPETLRWTVVVLGTAAGLWYLFH
jgi:hypothetical protein